MLPHEQGTTPSASHNVHDTHGELAMLYKAERDLWLAAWAYASSFQLPEMSAQLRNSLLRA